MPEPELPPIVSPAWGAARVEFSHSLAAAAIGEMHKAGSLIEENTAARRTLSRAPLESWSGVHSDDFRNALLAQESAATDVAESCHLAVTGLITAWESANTEQARRNGIAEQAEIDRREREREADGHDVAV